MDKYPSDLSGGQKQRAVIARAIILNPVLLVADEPVSMLDMSVRAKILELMLELKRELDLTYLYITHDLATAKFFCDRIAILYLGRIVEIGPSEAIYQDPKHPYTKALLRAIPEPDPRRTVPRDLPRGEVPDASRPPLGCSFHPRCPMAFEVCGWETRDLKDLLEARWALQAAEEYEVDQAESQARWIRQFRQKLAADWLRVLRWRLTTTLDQRRAFARRRAYLPHSPEYALDLIRSLHNELT